MGSLCGTDCSGASVAARRTHERTPSDGYSFTRTANVEATFITDDLLLEWEFDVRPMPVERHIRRVNKIP
eukprot:11803994-Karenia_brevis.AAC.1